MEGGRSRLKRVSTKSLKTTLPGISFSSVKVSAIFCSEATAASSMATGIRVPLLRLTASKATSYGSPVSFDQTLAHSSGCLNTHSWARWRRTRRSPMALDFA